MDDFNSHIRKASYEIEKSSEVVSPLGVDFSGQIELNEIFTKEEISARLNYAPWKYMPIKNIQVNFPADDEVEFSANLIVEKLPMFLGAVGFDKISKEDINKGLSYLKYASAPPVYARAKVKVENNNVEVSLVSAQVGRFSVPFEDYDGNFIVESVAEKIFSLVPGFYAKSVSFSPSGMHFEGIAPTKGVVLE